MLCGANTSYNLQSYNIIDHIMDSLSLYLYSHGFSQCWLHKDFHIYFPFCWNSGIHIRYVKQKIVQLSLCRGLRGALWASLSPSTMMAAQFFVLHILYFPDSSNKTDDIYDMFLNMFYKGEVT